MIERLHLKNFTSFRDLEINLSPKINVIIGENGTGKTQILKALYFANESLAKKNPTAEMLLRLFRPLDSKLSGLIGEDKKSRAEIVCEMSTGQSLFINFSGKSKGLAKDKFISTPVVGKPNLIPVKEVLSLMEGIRSGTVSTKLLQLLFDQSYLDIAKKMATKAPIKAGGRIEQNPRFSNIYLKLIELLGGKFEVLTISNKSLVTFKSGHYDRVIDPKSKNKNEMKFRVNRKDSADMTAEGLRKLGTLQLLLENLELNPGSSGILLWDEPEANLNPKLMKLVVELLLELARNGQQVVVTTHDYVLLKWFDLLQDKSKEDHVRFHVLYRDIQSGQVNIDSTDDYREIEKNPIAEAFNNLTIAHAQSRMKGAVSE